jgi:hypothetical protein
MSIWLPAGCATRLLIAGEEDVPSMDELWIAIRADEILYELASGRSPFGYEGEEPEVGTVPCLWGDEN